MENQNRVKTNGNIRFSSGNRILTIAFRDKHCGGQEIFCIYHYIQ